MHPELLIALAKAHQRDRAFDATRTRPDRPSSHRTERFLHRTGWLLVELGLRIATARLNRVAEPTPSSLRATR
jgi:hypothetical protein